MTALHPERPKHIFEDGPDMWHVATDPDKPHTRDFSNVGITEHDREIYRVRTRPHLYDDWHVAMVDDQRALFVTRLEKRLGVELMDWDCHKCHSAVITRADTYTEDTKCPKCERHLR